jgi:hypothetical protein
MMSEFTRLGDRVVLRRIVDCLEQLAAAGHVVTVDDGGDVYISDADRLDDEMLYELQASRCTVRYWLAARQPIGTTRAARALFRRLLSRDAD